MTEFSKKTGDFGVLSVPDLKVLALTLTLELRENGDANIRKEPLKVSLNKKKNKGVNLLTFFFLTSNSVDPVDLFPVLLHQCLISRDLC